MGHLGLGLRLPIRQKSEAIQKTRAGDQIRESRKCRRICEIFAIRHHSDAKPLAPLDPCFPFPFEMRSVHQISAAYSILGMTTPLYNFLIHLPFMPFVILIIRLHVILYFVPFAKAYAACSLKRSSSSMMIPKNLCERDGWMTWLPIVIGGLWAGLDLPGLFSSATRFLDRHTNAVESNSNSASCSRLQSRAPPGFSITFLSAPSVFFHGFAGY
jgi:hypothetical protein